MDLGNGDIHANSGYFNNIYDNGTGNIYFGSPVIFDEGIEINGDLTVENLYSQNIVNEFEIKTKDLTVTGQMHVFDLVIEQVSAAGGQLILSAAQFVVDDYAEGRSVTTSTNYGVAGNSLTDSIYETIYLYQISTDANGQKIRNLWQAGDHALCYTANIDQNLSTIDIRSWWTLVYSTGTEIDREINGEVRKCNMIEIVRKVTTTDGVERNPSWGEVTVQPGDNVCLLGSYNQDRRAAIVMSAHHSFDNNITAPAIVQYDNIEGFTLTGKAKTYFAKNGNKIVGDLIIDSTGQSVLDIINGIEHGYQVYVHTAYAHDANGTGFIRASQVVGNPDYEYIGFCSDYEPDDSDYTYDMYLWTRIKGESGEVDPSDIDPERDKLIPIRERLYLASDDKLYLDVAYYTALWKKSGNYITATLTTYGGSTTTRNVNSTGTNMLYYTNSVQNNWSEVENNSRYAYCTVYLKDSSGGILDQHAIQVVFEAGAVLSITDTIKSRVSDAEGNISTLVQRADSLTTRISDTEGNVSQL